MNGPSECPDGKVGEQIAAAWRRILRLQTVGRHSNFFELGGDSMLALDLVEEINQSLGASLQIFDLYMHPSIEELATRVLRGTTDDEPVDLQREARLDEEIRPLPGLPRTPARDILLTGATGFVGRFVLAQLLEDTTATIHCLVRALSRHEATARIKSTLSKWGMWREEFEQRVAAVQGDLSRPRLGLDAAMYDELSRKADEIYHCATRMNHLESYSMARAENVEAVIALLRLATRGKAKLLNHISSISIFSSPTGDLPRLVEENTPIDEERHWQSHGYAASKWIAEKIIMIARERAIPCNLFRLGLIWPDCAGRYDELQYDYRLLKSCLWAGYGIRNHRHDTEPVPADWAARAVSALAARHPQGHGLFHICSPDPMTAGLLERCNRILDAPLELLPLYDWIMKIKELYEGGAPLPIVPMIEFAFSMDRRAFDEQQRRSRSGSVRIDCARTQQELESCGIRMRALSDDALRACLRRISHMDNRSQHE